MNKQRGVIKEIIWLIIACLPPLFIVNSALGQEDKGYINPQLLASTQWLQENLDKATLKVIDLRTLKDYQAGHIRNALHLEISSLRTTVNGIPGMMPGQTMLEELLRSKGIGNGNQIVAYDNLGGLYASRLFLTLRQYGYKNIKLLDGGIRKWVAEGRPLTSEAPAISMGEFKAGNPAKELVDAQWVSGNLDNPNVVFVDVRSPKEFHGEDVWAKRGGHIPGAVNINWIGSLSDDNTTQFRTAQRLQAMFEQAGITRDKAVIIYSQSGLRASHTYFALLLLGYPNVKVYDGSWLEWGNQEDLPIQ